MREDYATVISDVRVPSAGLVWWRAELRARREAVRAAERPLTLVHAFAGACALGALIALLVQMSALFRQTFTTTFLGWLPETPSVVLQHLPLTLSLAVLLVLTPVALYFVFSDK